MPLKQERYIVERDFCDLGKHCFEKYDVSISLISAEAVAEDPSAWPVERRQAWWHRLCVLNVPEKKPFLADKAKGKLVLTQGYTCT